MAAMKRRVWLGLMLGSLGSFGPRKVGTTGIQEPVPDAARPLVLNANGGWVTLHWKNRIIQIPPAVVTHLYIDDIGEPAKRMIYVPMGMC